MSCFANSHRHHSPSLKSCIVIVCMQVTFPDASRDWEGIEVARTKVLLALDHPNMRKMFPKSCGGCMAPP